MHGKWNGVGLVHDLLMVTDNAHVSLQIERKSVFSKSMIFIADKNRRLSESNMVSKEK